MFDERRGAKRNVVYPLSTALSEDHHSNFHAEDDEAETEFARIPIGNNSVNVRDAALGWEQGRGLHDCDDYEPERLAA